jgi:aspartate/methionine/tyrosine aminotransferase
MFSRRLDWDVGENRLARAEVEARMDPRFIDLTVSNPTVVGLPDGAEQIRRAFAAAAVGTYVPSARGGEVGRVAVAEDYRGKGIEVGPERLLLTASTSESYSFIFKVLADPGDAVLVPAPSYPLFEYLARLEGVQPVPYRLAYGMDRRWHVDLSSVDEALVRTEAAGGRVRAVVVVSPNNPTGSVLTAEDAAALDARCAPRGAALIADEVFADFVRWPAPAPVPCLAAHPTSALTFSLGGLSKSCGLPQVKLGWIAVGGPAGAARATLDRLELVADTYLSVNAATEGALPDLLRVGASFQEALRPRLAANEARLARLVGPASSASALPSEGGWSAILRVPAVLSDEAWGLALLERERVLVHPGFFFDLEGGTFLVVSLLPEEHLFERGVERVLRRVEEIAAGRPDERDRGRER